MTKLKSDLLDHSNYALNEYIFRLTILNALVKQLQVVAGITVPEISLGCKNTPQNWL